MTTKKLIGFLILIVTLSFTTDNLYIITKGVGTDNLKVDKTKVKTALALLGKNDKFTEGIIDGNNFAIHINRYIYTKLGLTIISHVYEPKGEDLENAIIDNIIFEKPSNSKTIDNIVLGVDSKENIISKYGQPDSDRTYADVTYLHYKKNGISFNLDSKTKKLSAIEVYKPNGNPDND